MNLGFDFRQVRSLEGVMAALERMAARINTVWKKQHKADGTHGNITAENVIIEGDLIVDGVPITGGGGPPALHAPTHSQGGTDPVTVTSLAGYPGGTAAFLRADATFAAAGGGAPAAHAPTHNTGGSDPITALSGAVITSGTVPDARLSGNVALKNIDNNFSASQTVPSGFTIAGANAQFWMRDTSAPSTQQVWRMLGYSAGDLVVEALLDPSPGIAVQYVFGRNGTLNCTGLTAGNVSSSGGISASGNAIISGYVQANGHLHSVGAHIVAATGIYAGTDYYEKGRGTPLGSWIAVTHVGTNFYGGPPMTWQVLAGSQYGNNYTLIGNTMIWTVYLVNTTLGGAASAEVYIALPIGLTGAQSDGTYCEIWVPVEGWIPGSVNVEPGNSRVVIRRYNKAVFPNLGTMHIRFTITLRTA
jgi:hypothetical protein